mmetsp:Transcript_93055/g.259249  ORF Transcript_93055/g.259249 Transcript_93055/m.259249 type:complete len:390 (+) Transcript_93055:61-1230(+)
MASNKHWDGDGVPLKDSNCAAIGSEEDKAARKRAAQSEPQWQSAGKKVGVEVWRIEDFKVVPWPKKRQGEFYQGDSYIVLNTTKDPSSGKLLHGIHFWLGQDTSTDEMGTAAYKTVELDDFFDGEPTQHREVMGHESQQFLKLFPKLTYLQGGVASGFKKSSNATDVYETHLLHVRKTARDGMRVTEMKCERSSLNEGDCFVLDAGTKIYVWDGAQASPFEKAKANSVAESIESERNGQATATHDLDDRFWELLGGRGEIRAAEAVSDSTPEAGVDEAKLYQVSDATGTLTCKEVAHGKFSESMLQSEDVMMLALQAELFLWIGTGASTAEGRSALRLAMDYLNANGKPKSTPIHIFKQGQKIRNSQWNEAFGLKDPAKSGLACFAWCL